VKPLFASWQFRIGFLSPLILLAVAFVVVVRS